MFDVREKPKRVERALLVGVQHHHQSPAETDHLLDELAELVETLGISVVEQLPTRIRKPQPRFYLGSGKAEEIMARARELEADCIVFDDPLTPAQQRNWERASKLCVIDRQEVIIDIFQDRAQTREATLQVELARLEYSLPRLTRAWTHLSRQRGGGTTQRGEGEAQIELDQRMIREQIARVKRELEAVVSTRATQRKQRLRKPVPTASIVGYTNAGKSSLLRALTDADVLAEDKLFATLDPTTRRCRLNASEDLLLTDTVGFVRKLPHRLVEAFKATLEEAVLADFLIQVVDRTSEEADRHFETTMEVLTELGAGDKPMITVYNKIDRLPEALREDLLNRRLPATCYVSVHSGEGLDRLREMMSRQVRQGHTRTALLVPHDRYDVLNQLHRAGCIEAQKAEGDGIHVTADIPPRLQGLVAPFQVQPADGRSSPAVGT